MVPIGRSYCDACGHMPPVHVSCPQRGKAGNSSTPQRGNAGKGSGKNGRGQGSGKGKVPEETFAESQVRQELQDKLAKANKEVADARKAQQAAEARAKAAESCIRQPTEEPCGMHLDSLAEGGDSPDARIDAAKEVLRTARKLPIAIRDAIAIGYDNYIVQLEQDLDEAKAAKRETKSLKAQLEDAESYQKRATKRAEKAKTSLQKREDELAALHEQIESERAEAARLDEEVDAGKAAVSTLADHMATVPTFDLQ